MATATKQRKAKAAETPAEWVSVPWFAEHFGLGRATVYQAIKVNRLKAIYFGDTPRIHRTEVERVSKEGW